MTITACSLPENAFLKSYASRPGHYTDCFETDVAFDVSLKDFIEAFFTSPILRLERRLLGLAGMPSKHQDALSLADGTGHKIAGWEIEQRDENQLLLTIFQNGIRTWLMVSPIESGTKLLFGSAVIPKYTDSETPKVGGVMRALTGFHLLYSRIVLSAAKWQLKRMKRSTLR